MKILMMSDLYPPVIGGGERHVQALSRALQRRGHEVAVCTIGKSRLAVSHCTAEKGTRVYRMEGVFQKMPFLFKDPTRRWHPPIPDPLLTREISKIIRKEEPDVLHAHGWILCSYLPLAKKFGIPLVLTLHIYGFICPKKNLMKGNKVCEEPFTEGCVGCGSKSYGVIKSFFAYRGVKSTADKLSAVNKFIAVSSFVKEVYSKHLNIDNKRIVVIPNFYDSSQEDVDDVDLVESPNLPSDFILFIGDLTPQKGVDTLIKAYNRLNTTVKLVIFGRKDPKFSYKSAANMIVKENVQHDITMRAYSRARFVVVPSVCPDACPTVALEAMSRKKAVVASNTGGLRDIIKDGETGLLVPPNDYRKLAEALKCLIETPTKAKEMGLRGYYRFKEKFSVNKVVPRIEGVYEQVIALHRNKLLV